MSATAPAGGERARMRRARTAVSLAFAVFGAQVGLWFAHIPAAVERLALDPAQLSLRLLLMGAIGFLAQPLAGIAIARYGSRRTTLVLLPAFVIATTLLIGAATPAAFFAFAALTGLFAMPANVGNNTLATEFERRHGRAAMSWFHGCFSVGGLLGSLAGGQLIQAGYGDGRGALVAAALLLPAALWSVANALPGAPAAPAPRARPRLSLPAPAILGLCALVFCSTLIEGSVGDWSALYLATVKHADPALAAGGYTLFSLAMAAMRFAGGPIVERLGPRRLLAAGGALMAAGLAIVVLAPWPLLSAGGFLVVALGASNFVPILTSLAARTPGIAPSLGVAAIGSCMTLGLFAGPPAIGFIAQRWNLGVAFAALAVVAALVALAVALRRWQPAAAAD